MPSISTKIVYFIISFFSLALLYYLFVPIFQVHFIPALTNIANLTLSNAEAVRVTDNINNMYNIIMLVPFICVGALIVFLFISSLLKEETDSTF